MANKNMVVAKQRTLNWELDRVVGRGRWVNVVEWLMKKMMMMTFRFGFKMVGFFGEHG